MAKPRKVEEPAGVYQTKPKKPAKGETAAGASEGAVVYARPEDVRKAADKIFAERKELFRKLAQ